MDLHGKTALILVDVQKDAELGIENGIPQMSGGAGRVSRTREILAAARAAGVRPSSFRRCISARWWIAFCRGRRVSAATATPVLDARDLDIRTV